MTKQIQPKAGGWGFYGSPRASYVSSNLEGAAGGGGGVLQTFELKNVAGTTSTGVARFGLAFKQGDVPSGSKLVINRNSSPVDHQVDERVTWADGSLRFGVVSIRDTDFSGSELRTYEVESTAGSFDNTTTATITDVTSVSDLNVETSVYGSCSFNSASVTQIHSGPVCDTWIAIQQVGSDADLRAWWLVTRWKASNGSQIGIEATASLKQNNWTSVTKSLKSYDASLKDSTTTLASETGVSHPYHSGWTFVDKTADNSRYGRRPWISGAPTLNYYPDVTYWRTTGLIPPVSLATADVAEVNAYTPTAQTYTPCAGVGHRENVDGTGYYVGLGPLTNQDIMALVSKDDLKVRNARVSAFAGQHLPKSYRDSQGRILPAALFDPEGSTVNGKTWTGLPTPSDYCARSGNETDSFGAVSGGSGVWSFSTNDASHAVSYAYVQYLVNGERYYLDAVIDNATKLLHETVANEFGSKSKLSGVGNVDWEAQSGGMPTGQWAGLHQVDPTDNERNVGWATKLIAHAYNTIPDSHVAREYWEDMAEHNADYVERSFNFAPADLKNIGLYFFKTKNSSPWMHSYIVSGLTALHQAVRSTTTQSVRDYAAKFIDYMWTTGQPYDTNSYRWMVSDNGDSWSNTNGVDPWFHYGSVSLSGDTLTDTSLYKPVVNDTVKVVAYNSSGGSVTNPPEVTAGQILHVVNVAGDTYKLSATQGGAAITFTGSSINIAKKFNGYETTPAAYPPYLPDQSSYTEGLYGIMCEVKAAGSTNLTQSAIDNANAFVVNMSRTDRFNFMMEII